MTSVYEHLLERHFDHTLHKVWVDEDARVATFPLYDYSGKMTGYQTYRPDVLSKKENHPKDARYFSYTLKNSTPLWGLESWNLSNTLFVTEGVFDACRLTSKGMSAVAVLSCDVSKGVKSLFKLYRSFRPVVVVCDNDENNSGMKLRNLGHEFFVVPEKGDLGDASESVIDYVRMRYLHL